MGMYSHAASNLLLGTAIQESRLSYLKQLGGGPALGVYQIEPATLRDIYKEYLYYRPDLKLVVENIRGFNDDELSIIGNLNYATAIARLVYYRDKMALPDADDVLGLAIYWKRVYNTSLGKGTEQEFVKNYEKYILEK